MRPAHPARLPEHFKKQQKRQHNDRRLCQRAESEGDNRQQVAPAGIVVASTPVQQQGRKRKGGREHFLAAHGPGHRLCLQRVYDERQGDQQCSDPASAPALNEEKHQNAVDRVQERVGTVQHPGAQAERERLDEVRQIGDGDVQQLAADAAGSQQCLDVVDGERAQVRVAENIGLVIPVGELESQGAAVQENGD